MSGLGSIKKGSTTYLHIAGGFIWNKKKDETDPDYGEQEYSKTDGSVGVRKGAMYADLTGKITDVQFRTHDKYGESINVTFKTEEEKFIVSIPTNNRYSTNMMQYLLVADLEDDTFMKPYDFEGDNKKRATGISFRQNGEKVTLRVELPKELVKDTDWWKENGKNKKIVKRFFEDLNDWYVAEVEENVCSQFFIETEEEEDQEGTSPKTETKEELKPVEREVVPVSKAPSAIQMKKALRTYIAENYGDDHSLPKLEKSEVIEWYNLSLDEEELPFPEEAAAIKESKAIVADGDLDSQLDALMK